ncbi:aminotransferase class III-fold pyridoxal phosphate-dependent enzyme [Brevibacterium album]|uniref:aminotransferase class III-fold pyridoxal phosphate-dependent enzyme n=1 Tax=Brevibacterium album TaxID=417948 RepID=UPI000409F426|nr:aminotransferase class III-fold pyridoxal phosphate-dependent enzyme [Brevibacterium album]
MSAGDGRPQDREWRRRAAAVLPAGMYGHMAAQKLPEGYPQFMDHGEGCRLRDVDGREFIDFMCGWGPIVLGRRHPEVEEAVRGQLSRGDVMNGPTPVMVELAEVLTGMIPHADWTVLAKNGTDATTACVSTARAATGRRKILVAAGAYHGAAPWCSPSLGGVLPEDRAHLDFFEYNDAASAEAAADRAGDDLAGIIVSPVRQELGRRQEHATAEFARGLRGIADARGAALILDDVRCGFRLDLAGSWEPLGVRPDLAAWSKAIANGQPLAAVTGREWLRAGAEAIYVTGSFWYSPVPMAAALATLRVLRETDALERIRAAGETFASGLRAQASALGLEVEVSGPAQMPLLQFAGDEHQELSRAFADEAVRRGVYLHPTHNWFLSAAHGPEDIARALEITDEAFAALAARV